MKLKYYLRGLGTGILVTAIIMAFTKKPEELTDAEIKIRATQLGMVEKNVLADMQVENTEFNNGAVIENIDEILESEKEQEGLRGEEAEIVEEVAQEEKTETTEVVTEDIDVETEEVLNEEVLNEEVLNEESENTEEVLQSTEAENIESYIVISVKSGNGSEVVSQKLFEAGLVNSAIEYNRFLVKNGYDRKLRVGNHEIPAGASEEEMAKILCGMN